MNGAMARRRARNACVGLRIGICAVIAGCAPSSSGVVVMKIDDRQAHIAFEPGVAKVGDRVSLIESHCPSGLVPLRTRRPASDKCKQIVRGAGTTTKRLNEECGVAEFEQGADFEDGDAVQPDRAENVGGR